MARTLYLLAPTLSPVRTSGGGGGGDMENQWRSFDNSMDAVSFGFVATAILVSMFLVLAIFERFLRSRSDSVAGDEPTKPNCPSPKMTVYLNGVSVLMPGERIPTFIAHPAPVLPCPPEPALRPILDHDTFHVYASS